MSMKDLQNPSYSELSNILSYLDPNNRDVWYQVFRFVGRSYGANDMQALEICRSWANGATKRKQSDIKKENQEFANGATNSTGSIASLIFWAKQNGYTLPKDSHNIEALFVRQKSDPQYSKYEEVFRLTIRITKTVFYKGNDFNLLGFVKKYQPHFKFLHEAFKPFYTSLALYLDTHHSYEYDFLDFIDWCDRTSQSYLNRNQFNAMLDEFIEEVGISISSLDEIMVKVLDMGSSMLIDKKILELSKKDLNANDKAKKLQDIYLNCKFSLDTDTCQTNDNDFVTMSLNACLDMTNKEMYCPTGYSCIDDRILGYRKGGLSYICAQPGTGKTTLAINICNNLFKQGKKVLFVSVEMTKEPILTKFLKQHLRISKSDFPTPSQVEQYKKDIQEYTNNGGLISIYDKRGISLQDIINKCEIERHTKGLDFVMIDYLQYIKLDSDKDNWEGLRDVSQALSEYAKESNIAIVCLAQLKAFTGDMPTSFDIQGTSQVQKDAELIQLIWTPKKGEHGGQCNFMRFSKVRQCVTEENLLNINFSLNMSEGEVIEINQVQDIQVNHEAINKGTTNQLRNTNYQNACTVANGSNNYEIF